jgi:hypothetical protein
MTPPRDPARRHAAVLAAATLVALVSARDYAGGWNDGSRLATVETLVDHRTWAIDHSVFVAVLPGGSPYRPDDALSTRGTLDKLFINGHYYSDKSPVPALFMAGVYAALQALTGLTARARPDLFCWALTLLTSGVAYVVAVWSVFRLGRPLRLAPGLRVALTASFALATVALPYARHVNNHILLLAVTAALLVELVWLAEAGPSWPRLLGVGSLAGLAYTIDLGAGPVIALGAGGLVFYRCRFPGAAIMAAAALPWVELHHLLNYHIGGTWRPANAVAAYLDWPGSPFNSATMTGGWNHAGVGAFLLYAVDLLVGRRGFLGHNLTLFLAVPAGAWLLTRRRRERPEVLLAAGWSVGVWLVYAATSTNFSGACCSVRWYVPLLAPAYYLLAVALRDAPAFRRDFAVLNGWAPLMTAVMWWKGPWMVRMVPHYWVFVGGAAASWAVVRVLTARRPPHTHATGSVSCRLAHISTPSHRARSRSASSSTAKRSVA